MAVGTVFVLRIITKRWSTALLIGYILIILGETILFRTTITETRFELMPFWSYSDLKVYGLQIISNILLFIPFGVIAGYLWKWKSILIAAGFSLILELIQLLTHRGLFEFDDVIHNTAGAAIGFGLLVLMQKLIREHKTNREETMGK